MEFIKDNKKIIGVVTIIFIFLVTYKMISSNIQENKEKAVLQEKSRLEQLPIKQLQDCISGAKATKSGQYSYIVDGGFKVCLSLGFSKEECREQGDFKRAEADEEEKISIEECYRQYK